jgi:glycosyltransferase involved in cell wall biosynthesis
VKLAILIPVYNERLLLAAAVERLLSTAVPADSHGNPMHRVVHLTDDGSTDGTADVAAALAQLHPGVVFVHRHPVNRGKGAAIATSLRAALADEADVLVIHDADLEYDPADHERLLRPIVDGRADAVIGSRFLGETHRVLYFWHYQANRLITLACNVLSNLNLSDIECCLKAFTAEAARTLTLEEHGFGIEPELVMKLARLRLPAELPGGGPKQMTHRRARIYEVAVSYAGRTYAEGKKIRWTDGVRALVCILRYGLRPPLVAEPR